VTCLMYVYMWIFCSVLMVCTRMCDSPQLKHVVKTSNQYRKSLCWRQLFCNFTINKLILILETFLRNLTVLHGKSKVKCVFDIHSQRWTGEWENSSYMKVRYASLHNVVSISLLLFHSYSSCCVHYIWNTKCTIKHNTYVIYNNVLHVLVHQNCHKAPLLQMFK
jgi:hypothetical protein